MADSLLDFIRPLYYYYNDCYTISNNTIRDLNGCFACLQADRDQDYYRSFLRFGVHSAPFAFALALIIPALVFSSARWKPPAGLEGATAAPSAASGRGISFYQGETLGKTRVRFIRNYTSLLHYSLIGQMER